uniref:Uncharacterized protein n=1 Tax=Thermosporothrix sp. COM3 TaxID=2490863 RepID=A0A455SXA0_9CHLR|nr:hypothetical protein KTC_65520 [Thermosporothrix sp. COM3]
MGRVPVRVLGAAWGVRGAVLTGRSEGVPLPAQRRLSWRGGAIRAGGAALAIRCLRALHAGTEGSGGLSAPRCSGGDVRELRETSSVERPLFCRANVFCV